MIFFILRGTFWPDSFYHRLCRDINQGDGPPLDTRDFDTQSIVVCEADLEFLMLFVSQLVS